MKMIERLKYLIFSIILFSCSVVFFVSCSDDDGSTSSADELKIAIAWRADTGNEFCTNIVEAFAEAGVQVVVLDQVKAPYVQ